MGTDILSDDRKSEYVITKHKVRGVGEGRRLLNQIKLDVDLARVFPDSNWVNEALCFPIRIIQQHRTELPTK